jgi:probable H4MPT-linked C1 transfer pathway protein
VVSVLGLDIGGVNTKASFIETSRATVTHLQVASEYFPVWKRGKDGLPAVLSALRDRLTQGAQLDAVGATMTAELCDAFWSKREGVTQILDCLQTVFSGCQIWLLDVEAKLRSMREARDQPLVVAAANWSGTAWMVSQLIKNCLIVDTGSTTTTIIPVIDGIIAAEGKTDLEKLMIGELVYTGSLRTNIAAIVGAIPMRGGLASVSSELFSQSGDIHLILGNIKPEEYTVDTPDGRGKTKIEAMARLSRVVCADIEMLREEEILAIARYVYDAQIEQVAAGLRKVHNRVRPSLGDEADIVVTGLGRTFLARRAAEKLGLHRVVDLGRILSSDVATASPSVAVALMVASRLEGAHIAWPSV